MSILTLAKAILNLMNNQQLHKKKHYCTVLHTMRAVDF